MQNNKYDFYKENENDTIWCVNNTGIVGEFLFSFDKKNIFNLFQDYLYKLADGQVKIFDKENLYLTNFFRDRKKIKY